MVVNGDLNVFTGLPAGDVRLTRAPLERVICQLRWDNVSQLKYRFEEIAKELSLAISESYPFSDKEREVTFTVTPEGVSQNPGSDIWRYMSFERDSRVSFGESFIALETTSYKGREDFLGRLEPILDALASVVKIPGWNRLGYRYTNRLRGEDVDRISSYFHAAVVGGSHIGENSVSVEHSVSETVYGHEAKRLLVRTAALAPGQVVDPSVPPVIEERTWILDLDAHIDQQVPGFEVSSIVGSVTSLSRFAHDYFEAVITEEFVERFS